MERLTSRKNETVRRLRLLGTDRGARRAAGEFLCSGAKLLDEALRHGAAVTCVLWAGPPGRAVPGAAQYAVPREILDYVSPLKNAADPVFSVKIRPWPPAAPGKTLVLETVQDPGNLGTVLRTANALGLDTVILTGDCADPYGPKAVRAGMGAVFRQRFYELSRAQTREYLARHGLRLAGAALSGRAEDLRLADLRDTAVAIGSEGQGLSRELLDMCTGEVIIPMHGQCESLNAAAAAAIIIWELTKAPCAMGAPP